MRLRLLSVLLIAVLSGCAVRNMFTFFPDQEYTITSNALPTFITHYWIATKDGERLEALHWKHERPAPLVVYYHGNAGNLYHRLGESAELFQRGVDVLQISYRGYAKSSGSPDEEGIYLDGQAAIDFARDTLRYGLNQITLYGRSLGTTVAVNTGVQNAVRAIILVTPLTNGMAMAEAMNMGSLKSIAGNSYDNLRKINKLNCPILVLHGDQDDVIPYAQGKALFEAYKGEKEMVTIKGGGHNDLEMVDRTTYWAAVEKFLNN